MEDAPLRKAASLVSGLIVFGGASDEQDAYFALNQVGGIAAVDMVTGERKWFTPLAPADIPGEPPRPGQSAAVTAIPGVVFSGGWDGRLRAVAAWKWQRHLGIQHGPRLHHRERRAGERRIDGSAGADGCGRHAVRGFGIRRSRQWPARQCPAGFLGRIRFLLVPWTISKRKYEDCCSAEFWSYRPAGVEGTRTFITNNNFSTVIDFMIIIGHLGVLKRWSDADKRPVPSPG